MTDISSALDLPEGRKFPQIRQPAARGAVWSTKSLKVLMDGLQMGNRSGTGSYSERLLAALVSLYGEEHEFAAVCSPGVADTVREATGARVIAHGYTGFGAGTRFRNGSGRRSMAGLIRAERPDIVHYPANIGRIRRAPRRKETRTVLTVHDLTFFRNPAWFERRRAAYYRWGARRSIRYADRILADSTCTRDDLNFFLKVPEDRVEVTLLGVDECFAPASEERVTAYRREAKLPARFFLYAGTVEPRKNIERIVRAWDASYPEHGVALVVAGRDGWKTRGVERAIRNIKHRDVFRRMGFVPAEDLPVLYSAAETLVWPSLWEGFGLPPLEAMACGTPVITSNSSSLPEVTGEAALLVDPEDEAALARAMARMGTEPKLRAGFRNRGLNRARELTWRRTAEATMAAYRRVLGMDRSR